MSTQEVLRFLGISRGSLYNLYIRPGRLTPIRNPALRRSPLKFRRADVLALAAYLNDAGPQPDYSPD